MRACLSCRSLRIPIMTSRGLGGGEYSRISGSATTVARRVRAFGAGFGFAFCAGSGSACGVGFGSAFATLRLPGGRPRLFGAGWGGRLLCLRFLCLCFLGDLGNGLDRDGLCESIVIAWSFLHLLLHIIIFIDRG